MKTSIVLIGDIVAVNFHAAQFTLCHRAEVLSVVDVEYDVPWRFRDLDTNTIHETTEHCTISILNKA